MRLIQKGYDITNTHTPATLTLLVEKNWMDDQNRDKLRPASVTYTLESKVGEDGTWATCTLDNAEQTVSFAATWSDLPAFAAGKQIHYRIAETAVEGYTTAYSTKDVTATAIGGAQETTVTVTNIHVINKVTYSVDKAWEFGQIAAGLQETPESVTVQLNRSFEENGETVTEKVGEEETLHAANGWSKTWVDLDRYVSGKEGVEYTYFAEETDVPVGFTASKAVESKNELDATGSRTIAATITNTAKVTSLSVSKSWTDARNIHDDIASIRYTLQRKADGEDEWSDLETVTAAKEDAYAKTWNNLPTHNAAGKAYSYQAVETAVTGFSKSEETVKSDDGSYTTAVTNTLETAAISVALNWEDEDNQDGYRPEKIELTLRATVGGGTFDLEAHGINDTVTLNETGNWSDKTTWAALPKYDADGNEILYTLTENEGKEVPHYTADSNGLTQDVSVSDQDQTVVFVNTHDPETVTVTGEKFWDDNQNQDGKRPSSITVNLLANGSQLGSQTISEAEDGRWTYSFADVPKYDAGEAVDYSITENSVEYYRTLIKEKVLGETTIVNDMINIHDPETLNIEGSKVWDDGNNHDGIRPSQITVNLLANGVKILTETVKVGKDGKWNFDFPDLPEYASGVKINYTITEEPVKGYTSEISNADESQEGTVRFTITNSHKPTKGLVKGVSTDEEESSKDGTSKSAGAESENTSVKTGDETNLALWILLLLMSGMIAAGALGRRRKYRQ